MPLYEQGASVLLDAPDERRRPGDSMRVTVTRELVAGGSDPAAPSGDPRSGPLPDFVVIGAMKAGSTTLWRYLRDHPEVFMTDPKEPHFFVEEKNWGRGVDWYRAQFAGGRTAVVRGEASVTYTHVYDGVPERMATVVPGAKLVYLVRDPVRRMRSHYVHELAALREGLPIERALLEHPKYLAVSRYGAQLARFLQHYPRHHVHVVTTESLAERPAEVLAGLFAFLGVDPSWRPAAALHVNRSTRKSVPRPAVNRLVESRAARAVVRRTPVPWREAVKERMPRRPLDPERTQMSPQLVAELSDLLRDDVRELRHLTGLDLDHWGLA